MSGKYITTLRKVDTPTVRVSLTSESDQEVDPTSLPGWIVDQLDTVEQFMREVAPYLGVTDDNPRTFDSLESALPSGTSSYVGVITLRNPSSDWPKADAEVGIEMMLPYPYHDSYVALVHAVRRMAQGCLEGNFNFTRYIAGQLYNYGKPH